MSERTNEQRASDSRRCANKISVGGGIRFKVGRLLARRRRREKNGAAGRRIEGRLAQRESVCWRSSVRTRLCGESVPVWRRARRESACLLGRMG